ncbi:hypothetical protein Poli38472_012495 [Pythium oligandrum]|uniref:DUF6604 domain-containing protein n=1 Tax=Pythium oligandrum TaxID=41045 RepID=A0A8K1FNJ0_PYTOL|nr:hypothetical protein Poli38472_012495 [Pythium oligandrum]|eukprot:TMW67379.1 hypothetical protein Poli38472_012495 [Pythium oligandrum]
MASSSSPSFPSGIYRKYKRATEFFLDWLVRVRSHSGGGGGRRSKAGDRVTLEVLHRIVDKIQGEGVATLSPKLLHELPRALVACQCAITLREHVAQYFQEPTATSSGDANLSHEHFVRRLKTWYATLSGVLVKNRTQAALSQAETADVKSGKYTNYYEVLSVPDEFFPDADTIVVEPEGNAGEAPLTEEERKKLFDYAFAQDLDMEFACFLLELEELLKSVYNAYVDVKLQRKTLVEATVVAKMAIQFADAVIAKLQLRFPSIRLAQDVGTLLQDRLASSATMKLFDGIMTEFEQAAPLKQPPRFVPGSFLAEYIWAVSALMTFTSAIPSDPRQTLILRDGFFGENYDEERTPDYMLPLPQAPSAFLMQQLPLLFNTILANRVAGVRQDDSSLTGWFFKLLDDYFRSKRVTISLVFTTLCWIKSVTALQGDRCLGRTISLSIMHKWDLVERLEDSIAHGEVRRADQALHGKLVDLRDRLKQSDNTIGLLRANPLLAGFALLDNQFHFLHLGSESILVTSRFRAFCHLYEALCDRQLLRRISFVDDLVSVYERAVFTPSRASASHGAYFRTYMLSSHFSAASVDSIIRNKPVPARDNWVRVREHYHFRDLSRVYRMLVEKDTSVLPMDQSSLTWPSLLDAAMSIATSELFESRVLARDMLKVNDDLTDLFNALCDTLDQRRAYDANMARDDVPGWSQQYITNRALEDAVMLPLLPLLDCLQHDESIQENSSSAGLLRLNSVVARGLLDAEGVAQFARSAAVVIERWFQQTVPIELTFFTFPATPDWVQQEFGSAKIERGGGSRDAEYNAFSKLMDMFEEAEGPLSAFQLAVLKEAIRRMPSILALTSVGTAEFTNLSKFDGEVDVRSELSSLLHHAAAGPAHDKRLVEWMIQMGALVFQSLHCRHPPPPGALAGVVSRDHLYNALAVHCAAMVGQCDIMRILLEAENKRDLNTCTYRTKESLAHLAVKHNRREVYTLLKALGAEVFNRDAAGNRVSDLTSDPEWKRKIVALMMEQLRQLEVLDAHKDRSGIFEKENEAQSKRLRQALMQQRDEARTRQTKTTKANSGGRRESTGTKSSSRTPNSVQMIGRIDMQTTPSVAVEEMLNRMQQLFTSDPSALDDVTLEPKEDVDTLKQSLELLKDPKIDVSAREANAKTAVETIEKLGGVVQHVNKQKQRNIFSKGLRERLAGLVVPVIHLTNKFHRHLQSQPTAIVANPNSSVSRLYNLCSVNTLWLSMVANTAEVLSSCKRDAQARELIDLMERCLIKLPRPRDQLFRQWICQYVAIRGRLGLKGNASTPQVAAQLEWYLVSAIEEDDDALVQLDRFYGRGHYFSAELKCEKRAAKRFANAVYRALAEDTELVFIGQRVVASAETQKKLRRIADFFSKQSKEHNIQIATDSFQPATTELHLNGFIFSERGILRAS